MAIWDRYSAANGLDGLEIYDWRAEAVRFELTEGFPFAGFQDQCLKPLGRLSATSILERAGESTRIFTDDRKITVSDSPGSAMNTALNSSTVETGPALLTFTDSAADKIKQLIDEEDNPKLKLRVFVQGGDAPVSNMALLLKKTKRTASRKMRRMRMKSRLEIMYSPQKTASSY